MPTIDITRLRTLRQFSEASPAFTVRFLQYLSLTNKNGFRDLAVVQLGKKLMIDPDGVSRWVQQQKQAGLSRGD
jgi:hypothetical protein